MNVSVGVVNGKELGKGGDMTNKRVDGANFREKREKKKLRKRERGVKWNGRRRMVGGGRITDGSFTQCRIC